MKELLRDIESNPSKFIYILLLYWENGTKKEIFKKGIAVLFIDQCNIE